MSFCFLVPSLKLFSSWVDIFKLQANELGLLKLKLMSKEVSSSRSKIVQPSKHHQSSSY